MLLWTRDLCDSGGCWLPEYVAHVTAGYLNMWLRWLLATWICDPLAADYLNMWLIWLLATWICDSGGCWLSEYLTHLAAGYLNMWPTWLQGWISILPPHRHTLKTRKFNSIRTFNKQTILVHTHSTEQNSFTGTSNQKIKNSSLVLRYITYKPVCVYAQCCTHD